ncbi:hypothetical protein IRP63_14085 (plasmid) [Clostridium botulinum]|uniref:Uncharacterized protein n=1 Tax=Clostridium botulinum C/D str. DC5 TaxID=1443128 RepID=A0A0A0HWG2_CLOBO|nr:hypothetical protein [Clostridium botulinum]KGM93524.1 hypothetical protein Z955_14780 [Clostridium botulinum C/D str. DC5]KOC56876.1 hypothetical protein ADU89_01385 [Clostridium botulinum]KOC57351.1 hypothetical protein ADU90_05925 [Clostridium botulinum]MCD3232584.1 hypothetical protein [Clostridium botulinum D/C]MCD3238487.1 hypothetical protein [Clostridium botulinum D/C]
MIVESKEIEKLIATYKVQMKTCKEMLEDNLISVSSNEYLETRINTYRDVIWDLKRMIEA